MVDRAVDWLPCRNEGRHQKGKPLARSLEPGGGSNSSDVSVGKSYLLLIANVKEANETDTRTIDPVDRLLERVSLKRQRLFDLRSSNLRSRMRGPQVRFCERPGGVIPRAYSTEQASCRSERRGC